MPGVMDWAQADIDLFTKRIEGGYLKLSGIQEDKLRVLGQDKDGDVTDAEGQLSIARGSQTDEDMETQVDEEAHNIQTRPQPSSKMQFGWFLFLHFEVKF